MKGARAKRYDAYRRKVASHTRESVKALGWEGKASWIDADHTVSKSFGFKHGIDPAFIGSKENLQLMERNKNIEKGQGLTAEGCQLLRKWGYTDLADAWEMRLAA